MDRPIPDPGAVDAALCHHARQTFEYILVHFPYLLWFPVSAYPHIRAELCELTPFFPVLVELFKDSRPHLALVCQSMITDIIPNVAARASQFATSPGSYIPADMYRATRPGVHTNVVGRPELVEWCSKFIAVAYIIEGFNDTEWIIAIFRAIIPAPVESPIGQLNTESLRNLIVRLDRLQCLMTPFERFAPSAVRSVEACEEVTEPQHEAVVKQMRKANKYLFMVLDCWNLDPATVTATAILRAKPGQVEVDFRQTDYVPCPSVRGRADC